MTSARLTVRGEANTIALRLGREAEAVCRRYLSCGRRQGNYWQVGDVRNTPGRSMFVRLHDTRKGPAGKWSDAATGEHGDLLDVIRQSCGLVTFADVLHEARAFLSLPRPEMAHMKPAKSMEPVPVGSAESARRLFAMARPITGSLAQAYLAGRGISNLSGTGASLKFHPACYHVPEDGSGRQSLPAIIAAVTDLSGHITGAHRTWLSPNGSGKAKVMPQRKAMGDLLGHAVRFAAPTEVPIKIMAAGEGIETVLSLRQVLPSMAMAAALSANHLAAMRFPSTLRRLYIIRDTDPAGAFTQMRLIERADAAGIEAVVLSPRRKDFNADLQADGADRLRAEVRVQIMAEDVARFAATA